MYKQPRSSNRKQTVRGWWLNGRILEGYQFMKRKYPGWNGIEKELFYESILCWIFISLEQGMRKRVKCNTIYVQLEKLPFSPILFLHQQKKFQSFFKFIFWVFPNLAF